MHAYLTHGPERARAKDADFEAEFAAVKHDYYREKMHVDPTPAALQRGFRPLMASTSTKARSWKGKASRYWAYCLTR